MRVAVCPGSFDPVTFGHLDIIRRAAGLFDEVRVAVLENSSKSPLFTIAERIEFLEGASADLENVRCEAFSGLVVSYARSRGAAAIIRGLRAVSDFEHEFKMAAANYHLDSDVETIFMMTHSKYSFISSSIVKEVAAFGGDVTDWVPAPVARRLREKFAGTQAPQDE